MTNTPQKKQFIPPLKYPENYEYLLNLPREKYEWYLKLLFWTNRRMPLDLKNPKTLNEKLQWLKLYNTDSFITKLTDKIQVRNYVKQKIGKEYLKQIFQICNRFEEINFERLPNSFYIKCNHGCKWQIFIKDKNALLSNSRAYVATKKLVNKWLTMKFFAVGGLELQYIGIQPKVFIEKVVEKKDEYLTEFEIYCFNGEPKINQKVLYTYPAKRSVWDEQFEISNIQFDSTPNHNEIASEEIKKASKLSKILAKDLKFVRIDWLYGKEGLFFNEMTFTPSSGFIMLTKETDKLLGSYLNLNTNEQDTISNENEENKEKEDKE